MPIIHDPEFGDITVRRSAQARAVRIRVAPDGSLRASLPMYTPLLFVKRLVKQSRDELRTMLEEAQPNVSYSDGMQIGKSHFLQVRPGSQLQAKRRKQHITLTLPAEKSLTDSDVVTEIRRAVRGALRIEAKSYLPKRLAYLAQQYDFRYETVRVSHASSRWGSCSSNGTISLNIALMKLPFELIDYVLIHELAHTRHMNHSPEFWAEVGRCDPDYVRHKKRLKLETPTV